MTRLQPLASANAPWTKTTVFCEACCAVATAESIRMKKHLNMFVLLNKEPAANAVGQMFEPQAISSNAGRTTKYGGPQLSAVPQLTTPSSRSLQFREKRQLYTDLESSVSRSGASAKAPPSPLCPAVAPLLLAGDKEELDVTRLQGRLMHGEALFARAV